MKMKKKRITPLPKYANQIIKAKKLHLHYMKIENAE